MTKQVPDKIIWEGEVLYLESNPGIPFPHPKIPEGEPKYSNPLDSYLDITGTTACRRKYIATWEVIGHKLYLVEIEGWRKLSEGPVFASWVSKVLKAFPFSYGDPSIDRIEHIEIEFCH